MVPGCKSFIESSGKYVLDRKVIDSIYNEDDTAVDFTLEAIEEALEEFKRNAEGKTSPKHSKIYEIDKFEFKDKFLQDIDNDIALFELINIKLLIDNIARDDSGRLHLTITLHIPSVLTAYFINSMGNFP